MFKITDELLMKVTKPSRYTGGEVNSYKKNLDNISIRFAMCFPDAYEVGMSHLGMKIIYDLLNRREDTFCERVFAPWSDMEAIMRENKIKLFSLETKDSLDKFDMIGFTLQYEMSYTNIINMLNLSDIPLLSKDREGFPFIVCGGPCAYNPEPISDIVDFFVLGEGEEVLNEIMDVYLVWKKNEGTRIDFLEAVSKVEGVYVPSFYKIEYNTDGTIKARIPLKPEYPMVISKRIVNDFTNTVYPERYLVPLTEIVHDRISLEIFRGCTRGCRFCQAGMIYRPVREKEQNKLIELADTLIKKSGYDELSLMSLSTCDYSEIHSLVHNLIKKYEGKKVGVSLPSLRIDSFSVDLINEIQKVRKTGLTFAPEAGTQRMRDVINKGVTEENLIKATKSAFESGWSTIKLYFMIGLPYETLEDVEGIAQLAYKVVDIYKEIPKEQRKKGLNITVSTSSFVPKPFTPFQWEAQNDISTLREKQQLLKSKIKSKFITYNWHESPVSFLEAVFARGDRRLNQVLIKAWEKGCKFDGWQEFFNNDKWMEAFKECNIDPEFYVYRKREYDEILPWDFINIGVNKAYLIKESEKAKEGILTHDCREGCTACGVSQFIKKENCFNGKIPN